MNACSVARGAPPLPAMIRHLLATALLCAPALAAADVGPDATMVSLKQISVDLRGVESVARQAKIAALAAAAPKITSCDQVEGVAAQIGGASVTIAESVPMTALPAPLRQQVAGLKVGTATQLYGQQTEAVRVLVLCGRH